jgi:dephospho-CoA kinase
LLFIPYLPIINGYGYSMRKVIAIVGMAGSGKSEVAKVFENSGFVRIRFGDITDIELQKRGLELSEANERPIRERLRKELGMAAYAILNRPLIDTALKTADVVADGLYSWEEYLSFKSYYGKNFYILAVYASPTTRYSRLLQRNHRSLTLAESVSRDKAEIENMNKGGPIAMADFTVINESSLDELRAQAETVISRLKNLELCKE